MEFTDREKWIAITSIMKVSQNSKSLTKEQRDGLFLELHRTHASSLKDPEIREIEKNIVDLGRHVQESMMDSLLEKMGTQDKKKVFEDAEKLVGKENVEKVIKKLQDHDDENHV